MSCHTHIYICDAIFILLLFFLSCRIGEMECLISIQTYKTFFFARVQYTRKCIKNISFMRSLNINFFLFEGKTVFLYLLFFCIIKYFFVRVQTVVLLIIIWKCNKCNGSRCLMKQKNIRIILLVFTIKKNWNI